MVLIQTGLFDIRRQFLNIYNFGGGYIFNNLLNRNIASAQKHGNWR